MFTEEDFSKVLGVAIELGFDKEAILKHFNKISQKDSLFSPKSSFMFISYNDDLKEKDMQTYRIHRALIDLIEDTRYKYAMIIDNPTGKTLLLHGAACQEITQNATIDLGKQYIEYINGESYDCYPLLLSIKRFILTLGSRRILDYMKE